MIKYLIKNITILVAILVAFSCAVDSSQDIDISGVGGTASVDTRLAPSCVVESRGVSRAYDAGVAVRSLVDQVTTKRLDSNFLRIDEDLNSLNDGKYTFTGNDASAPYATNWNKALLLEASVSPSPDNTPNIHYRSISLAPVQSYKLNIVEEKIVMLSREIQPTSTILEWWAGIRVLVPCRVVRACQQLLSLTTLSLMLCA